jgi:C1A family cysteine protease
MGFPVVFGFTVYESFEGNDVATTGNMPMPASGEKVLGGHAVALVGFNDDRRVFIVRNSWGASWGDQGYFYMPYEFITNPEYASDFWSVRKTKDLQQ